MSDVQSGEVFGGYTIIETLSEGPIARLCRAVHGETGERVLLRILGRFASQNPQLAAAFEELRDRHSGSRITHPAVLRVLDVGEQEGCRYVAYEDFDGVPLDEFVREQRPSLRDGLRLAILITEGLDAVHSRRVTHGDLKPKNILVRRMPRNRIMVKLAMSDLATSSADAAVSIYGALVGTPKYMAPEQIMGRRPTPASDIFSLGVILYELFSGQEPFPADGPLGYLRKNAEETARPLAMVDSSIPAELSKVVERMLERDPVRRYRSAASLLEDLERVELRLEGATPASPPPGTDSAFAEPVAARSSPDGPWRAVALTALAATLLLAVALVYLLVVRAPQRPAEPAQQPVAIPVPPQPQPSMPEAPRPPAPAPAEQAVPVVETPQPQPPTPPTSVSERLEATLREVRDALAAGNTRAALEKLSAAEERFRQPEQRRRIAELTVEARLQAAEALLRDGREDDAVAAFKAVADDFPAVPAARRGKERAAEILSRRAIRHQNMGRIGDALRVLEGVARDFPDTVQGRKAQAELPLLRARYAEALRVARPDDAVETMRRALASASEANAPDLQRRLAALLIHRAGSRLQEERFDDCLKDLAEARTLDADADASARMIEPKALLGRIRLLRRQGDIAGAVADWQRLRERYPAAPETAIVMREMPDIPRIAKSGPVDNAAILLNLAEEDLAAGNRDAAREKLKKIIANHPASPQAREAAQRLSRWEMVEILRSWQTGDFTVVPKLEAVVANYPGTEAAEEAAKELARYRATPKDMVYVPGGPFIMGLSPEAAQELMKRFDIPPNTPLADRITAQRLGREVHVAPFYIDRCEVTNAQYKAFVDATNGRPPRSPTWVGSTIRKGYEDYPVTGITWREAADYAAFAGKRLPTEAEWEKAARGTDGRYFPWGNEFDKGRAVIATDSPRPVGSIPSGASPYGALDMVGNAQEWTGDKYALYGDTTVKPAIETPGGKAPRPRVVRGAAWNEQDEFSALCTARWPMAPDSEDVTVGFRCVRDVK